MVEDFTITVRTVDAGAEAAANRFMVPMTLISWVARRDIWVESTTRKVWMIVSI